jgi:selenide,water dikinase
MSGIDFGSHPNLLVGLEHPDDAGVYRLTDDIALVQTVDFFTPIVDDPFVFGQIAAANALSDVYAMGATPITAMNIVTFPSDTMTFDVLREILKGGLDKTREAHCPLVGGHTVKAPELKYGLSVTGTVHPDRVWTNTGARAGDAAILTKPLGTGIISTALKGNAAHVETAAAAASSMATLNRVPSEVAAGFDVHACTDITGFGLAGHVAEMLSGTGLGIELDAAALPVFPNVEVYCDMGLLPGGLARNRNHVSCRLEIGEGISMHIADVVCDPQTSGGLLFAVPSEIAPALVAALEDRGVSPAIVGRFVEDKRERVFVK